MVRYMSEIQEYVNMERENHSHNEEFVLSCECNSADSHWMTMASENPTIKEPRLGNAPQVVASKHHRVTGVN
jgi:hypothetical protein